MKIFLVNSENGCLCIRPGSSFIDESFFIKYDVKIKGETIFRRGAKVIGEWISEEKPIKAAQFRILEINGHKINGDSLVFQEFEYINPNECKNLEHFYLDKVKVRGLERKFARLKHTNRILSGIGCDTPYIRIHTNELVIILKFYDVYNNDTSI